MRWNILSKWHVLFGLIMCYMILAEVQNENDEISCDVDANNSSCPAEMCCVRNETLFGEMYCQHFGDEGDICANYTSQFLCDCKDGYYCKIDKDGLFGTCKQKILDIPCNLSSRADSCPQSHCCVRDEFLFTLTYCKPYGVRGSNCVTRPSFYECPCRQEYFCESNQVEGHVHSVFGTCRQPKVPVG